MTTKFAAWTRPCQTGVTSRSSRAMPTCALMPWTSMWRPIASTGPTGTRGAFLPMICLHPPPPPKTATGTGAKVTPGSPIWMWVCRHPFVHDSKRSQVRLLIKSFFYISLDSWSEDASWHCCGLGGRKPVLDGLWQRRDWGRSDERRTPSQNPDLRHDWWATLYCGGSPERVSESEFGGIWKRSTSQGNWNKIKAKAFRNKDFFFRKMYWTDWGNHPKIETAAMDGTMRETLIDKNIQWPTGKTYLSLFDYYNLL